MSPYVWKATVNGTAVELQTQPAQRLLTMLRDELGLTGTKVSCELGRCGACMVLMDGKLVNACLMMAYQSSGCVITTIEGLAGEELHPIQQAFLAEGGFQCGYCTPGMILAVKALLDDYASPTSRQIGEALAGNLCRCTGYGGILRAVQRCCRTTEAAD
ncbi:(2Fe-2S)-binding protein [Paenibacillus sp. 1P07SE]|uniref:(2Fe-2S)-binding protein n=1 Tax=Paenibacillus sp. 1P07SE TaxID=3132209 RepID=UPI0039A6E134